MSLKIWLPLNGNIENQGTLNTTSRLPSGYTEVEYLESTGTQYIDTGVDNNTNSIKLYTTIQVTVPASVQAYALGYYTDNQGQFFLYRAGNVWQWGWRCGYLNSTGTFDTNKHSHMFYVENGTSYYKLDGQIVSQQTANRTGGRIYIAGNKHNQSTVRTFTAAIDDGNIVKRNFVPCYRNSDNKPGMYDTVTGTFYTNAGSGEFSVGPAVTCSITNNGATVDNNGKIGKCYSFNGSSNYVQLTNSIIEGKKPFTFSVWYKTTSGNSYYPIISVGTSSNGFTIHGSVNRLEGGNGTNHFNSSNHITAVSWGMWAHLAVTYDGTKIQSYLNGVPNANSLSWTYGFGTGNTTIKIGHFWGGYFKGYINDFRLYDECLSADQIKEISRGMVLHYKMCGNVQTPNNCYAYPTFDISVTDGGWSHWTASGGSGSFAQNTDKNFIFRSGQTYSHKVTCDSSATYDYLCYQEPAFSGGYRSICAIIKASDGAKITENICYPHWNSRNGGVEINKWTSINKLRDGFYLCKCEGIKQDGSNDLVGIYVRPGKTIYISECYLENDYEKCSDFWTRTGIEYDGSGFKNHGTVTADSAPILSSDTKRYNGSYLFNGNQYIESPKGASEFLPTDSITVSWWGSMNNWNYYGRAISCTEGGGWNFELNNGKMSFVIYIDSKGYLHALDSINASDLTSGWHHWAATYDKTILKLYRDGQLVGTGEEGYTGPIEYANSSYKLQVGRECPDSAYFVGNISDVRIYTTALSQEDITNLYKMGI